jgi:hypothetical protein
MASRAVSLRIPEELLLKLEADALEGESIGATIQRILLQYYAVMPNSEKINPIQLVVADEVEKSTKHLAAAYHDLKTEVDELRQQISQLSVTKTSRKKPLTS